MTTEALRGFRPDTQAWFDASFAAPTEVQERGWAAIHRGAHALLVAPTGSGKTLAAFLAGIDSLLGDEPTAGSPADVRGSGAMDSGEPGVRVLYVSPLKALVYDVERNLRAPLAGIRRSAERDGRSVPDVRVDIRTGDTSPADRRRQLRDPADILVTTPESLYLLLGARARETLRTVHTVILDEVHALASTKRGSHLALSLERLSEMTAAEPQRIGLSATVRPLAEVARWMGGDRDVEVVDASRPPSVDLLVTVPVPDMSNPPAAEDEAAHPAGGSVLGQLYDREARPASPERGVWAAILPKILEEIERRRTTIVFVNSRGLCERLAQRLNDLSGEDLVRAHHG
ncbi:MAG: DEAD/DEAH box helicase, partial [Gemmatimonadetes bacterium]|nr:DEAD/DEAH box helicase [Gemmatimonadota bacterium]